MGKIFEGSIEGKKIKDGNVVLVAVPARKLAETNTELLKWYVSEKNYDAVYVTINKPFSTLIDHFKEEKIDTKRISVIDAVSPRTSVGSIRAGNAVFVGSPKALTNISITTTSTIKRLKTAKVLIFDSLCSLITHNSFEAVKDFVRFISIKMKDLKVTFVMTCAKEVLTEQLFAELSAFVDDVVDIK